MLINFIDQAVLTNNTLSTVKIYKPNAVLHATVKEIQDNPVETLCNATIS